MPICSYVVAPVQDKNDEFREEVSGLPECEKLAQAEERNLYVLVTETGDFEHQNELEDRLQSMECIDWLVQSFGELVPEEGQVEQPDRQPPND